MLTRFFGRRMCLLGRAGCNANGSVQAITDRSVFGASGTVDFGSPDAYFENAFLMEWLIERRRIPKRLVHKATVHHGRLTV
jgi:hypothetical protein